MYDSQDSGFTLKRWVPEDSPETCRNLRGSPPGLLDLQGSLDLCDWKHDPHQVDLFGTAVRSVRGEVWNFRLTTVKSHTLGGVVLVLFLFFGGLDSAFFGPGDRR